MGEDDLRTLYEQIIAESDSSKIFELAERVNKAIAEQQANNPEKELFLFQHEVFRKRSNAA